ncbi:hypothetical protein [Dactylosporangium sp. CS-033363]|uniref:hypothetical protein n=1 Tax=Dactylosporangium sp. CS-033363 TaxID=3239935 RepID=UPI003D8DA618
MTNTDMDPGLLSAQVKAGERFSAICRPSGYKSEMSDREVSDISPPAAERRTGGTGQIGAAEKG